MINDVQNMKTTYRNMIARCNDEDGEYFKRGIKVCDRWLESFDNFLNDMGFRPKNSTFDRIDNSKSYYPENCRWTTYRNQNLNKRKYKNNTTGVKGVYFDKRYKKYYVKINTASGRLYLGRRDTKEEAIQLRKDAEQKYNR